MSTRCQIQVQGSPILIYKHCDGYPEDVLATLEPFAKAFAASRGEDPEYCLAQIVRVFAIRDAKDDEEDKAKYPNLSSSYRFTGWGLDLVIHGDIEYFYVVDSKAGTVTVHTSEFEMAYARGER